MGKIKNIHKLRIYLDQTIIFNVNNDLFLKTLLYYIHFSYVISQFNLRLSRFSEELSQVSLKNKISVFFL